MSYAAQKMKTKTEVLGADGGESIVFKEIKKSKTTRESALLRSLLTSKQKSKNREKVSI